MKVIDIHKVGWYVVDLKDKVVFGPGEEHEAIAKCKALGGDEKGFATAYMSDYDVRRQTMSDHFGESLSEKKNFHHQGKSNSSHYDGEGVLRAKSNAELDAMIAKYGNHPHPIMQNAIKKAKAERAKRVGVKQVKEDVQFTFLAELLNLVEFETPGLKLGALRFDSEEKCIYVTIGGDKYKYIPHVAEKAGQIYSSVTGMAKHSTGRALAFLKKNATGEKLNENMSPEQQDEEK